MLRRNSASAAGRETIETGREVGDQLVRTLEADVQPDERTRGLPARGAAQRRGIDGQRQALEAAPGKTDTEQREPIDQRGARGIAAAGEDEAEQPRSAGEIAREDLVPGTGGQRRMGRAKK